MAVTGESLPALVMLPAMMVCRREGGAEHCVPGFKGTLSGPSTDVPLCGSSPHPFSGSPNPHPFFQNKAWSLCGRRQMAQAYGLIGGWLHKGTI